MTIEQEIKCLCELGKVLKAHGHKEKWHPGISFITEKQYHLFEQSITDSFFRNGWFEEKEVRSSLKEISQWLTLDQLDEWQKKYPTISARHKTVAIIMAGNIPLVGFHDFLCVLISGFNVKIKLSTEDSLLLPAIVNYLALMSPEMHFRISFTDRKIGDYDAIIATGDQLSTNTFQTYFSAKPHLFRGNRTSVAVLNGSESDSDLALLGQDIFQYFGRGCRNVTHLIVPKGFRLDDFYSAIFHFSAIIQNKKYGNNYDYNKAIHLMNLETIFDNNFLLLKKSEVLHAPIAMLHYHEYEAIDEVLSYLERNKQEIQCVVGDQFIPFGAAQKPSLVDYADNIDTMQWLRSLDF